MPVEHAANCHTDLGFHDREIPRWVAVGDRIGVGVEVFMERHRVLRESGKFIHRHEPPRIRVHVACPQVVEAEFLIELFAAIAILIFSGASLFQQQAKRIVCVGICNGLAGVG